MNDRYTAVWIVLPSADFNHPPFMPGFTGPLPVEVEIYHGTVLVDGSLPRWTTPSGACTLVIDSSECDPCKAYPPITIVGHGSCSAPAAPDPGNPSSSTISVGNFTLSAQIADEGPYCAP